LGCTFNYQWSLPNFKEFAAALRQDVSKFVANTMWLGRRAHSLDIFSNILFSSLQQG
jgi:hypothetical protein